MISCILKSWPLLFLFLIRKGSQYRKMYRDQDNEIYIINIQLKKNLFLFHLLFWRNRLLQIQVIPKWFLHSSLLIWTGRSNCVFVGIFTTTLKCMILILLVLFTPTKIELLIYILSLFFLLKKKYKYLKNKHILSWKEYTEGYFSFNQKQARKICGFFW